MSSMSQEGRCWDNTPMARWREWVWRRDYANQEKARRMIFYYQKRLNSVLGDISPAESGRVGGACQLKPAPVQASPFLFFCLLGLHVDLAF